MFVGEYSRTLARPHKAETRTAGLRAAAGAPQAEIVYSLPAGRMRLRFKPCSIEEIGTPMKAAFFMQHGGPEVLQYGEVPDPVAGPGELLVDVHAASVNAATGRCVPEAMHPLRTSRTCWAGTSRASSRRWAKG